MKTLYKFGKKCTYGYLYGARQTWKTRMGRVIYAGYTQPWAQGLLGVILGILLVFMLAYSITG